MKDIVLNILSKYLEIFPNEKERQEKLIEYLENNKDKQITDWSNFDGHITAGGFIYAAKENKILLLYHKDLNMYLYPGGHAENSDVNPLDTAKREVFEETGLDNLKLIAICDNKLIPIDIDTHIIEYNKRRNLPEHYHFDFRYLFIVDNIKNIKIDEEESKCYKWIDLKEIKEDKGYNKIAIKIEDIIGRKINIQLLNNNF